jgi:DNA-binding NarL/FixJ family response regulator
VRVVIADDSAVVREGLSSLLGQTGVEVCATARDAAGLVAAVEQWQPDVAITDIRMPPTFTHEGAEAAVALRERWPDLGVLLLSQAVETHYAAQLIDSHPGRFGYLLKDRVLEVETLTGALETIVGGGTVLDPDVVRHLLRRTSPENPLRTLTEREREVLLLMATGLSNVAIAGQLTVTLKTVESHIARVFDKLGLHGHHDEHRRVSAVLTALEWKEGS